MCLNPISVINPTKYVSIHYRDRYLMQVPCGKCAQCLTNKSNEWSFRLFHHALDTFRNHGFVLFDTLTYSNAFLPHISDYISDIDASVDFPTFRSYDLRLFVADLRQRCKRKYKSNFSYFISSEYGTSEFHLHRPHYHALFFVSGKITPFEFSALVAETWFRGRTDGIPYQSAYHVGHNAFTSLDDGALRSIKYVCKYIQKSCQFQKEIDKRLAVIMKSISERFEKQGVENWSESSHYWRLRDKISRKLNQFHRQSTFLGASYLSEIDLNQVFNDGVLYMPDNDFVVKSIPIPTYYKRKLFSQLVEVDGSRIWIPNEIGIEYQKFRLSHNIQSLSDRLYALSLDARLPIDSFKLAKYVLTLRGRFNSSQESTFEQRLSSLTHYNYISRYDKEQFEKAGLSFEWLGNSSQGFKRCRPKLLSIRDFMRKYVYLDSDLESQLDKLYSVSSKLSKGKQSYFAERQRLINLYHHFFP